MEVTTSQAAPIRMAVSVNELRVENPCGLPQRKQKVEALIGRSIADDYLVSVHLCARIATRPAEVIWLGCVFPCILDILGGSIEEMLKRVSRAHALNTGAAHARVRGKLLLEACERLLQPDLMRWEREYLQDHFKNYASTFEDGVLHGLYPGDFVAGAVRAESEQHCAAWLKDLQTKIDTRAVDIARGAWRG